MSLKKMESFAVVSSIIATVFGISLPFLYESYLMAKAGADVDRVITLTGVARTGVWTDEPVHGANYWRREFPAAELVLKVGESVLIRLKSADDTHSFYIPDLGVGPEVVYPGKVSEIRFTPDRMGRFRYVCTILCGACHFWMQGMVVVLGADGTEPPPSDDELPAALRQCVHHITYSDQDIDFTLRGHVLFETIGCITCHGPEGRGGVKNLGYVKKNIPTLNVLAEKMMLFEKEDVEAITDLLERRIPLASLEDDPPVALYSRVLAQYDSICKTILFGSMAGKETPESPEPPYHMPRWTERLSDEDIDSILVYMLKQYPWDQEEEEFVEDEETVEDEESMEDEGTEEEGVQ